MASVVQCDTNLANWHFASLAKVLQLFFVVIFLRTKDRSFHYIFIVLDLKVFERQDAMIFVNFHDVVSDYALLTVKHTALETIGTFRAALVAISTFHLAGFTFSNCQHINQAVQIKTGGKIFQIATFRHSAKSLALRASDCVSAMASSVPLIQAMQTKAVETWELFWIHVYVSAHWTRHFFSKIMEQRFNVHVIRPAKASEQR